MRKRILLMHISNISGHREASLAIEKAINLKDATAQVLKINIFDYTLPVAANIINKIYIQVIKKVPSIWGYLYDNQRIIAGTKNIKDKVYRKNFIKIKDLIDSFKPDVVIATQAFPCAICARFKTYFNSKFKLIAVLTDYAFHSYWLEEGIDYYVVGNNELKNKFIEKGVSGEKIKILGIPIDPKFNSVLSKKEILTKYHLDPTKPIILVMGGGQGLGPIKRIIQSINRIDIDLQILLVCGSNKKLELQIKNKVPNIKKKLIVFGFVRNIEELMTVASLIITKSGGLTTAEALAKGLPLIIISPIPGQETVNANFIVRRDCGVYIKKLSKINKALKELLTTSDKLKTMQKNAAAISKPNSSLDIASLALSLC